MEGDEPDVRDRNGSQDDEGGPVQGVGDVLTFDDTELKAEGTVVQVERRALKTGQREQQVQRPRSRGELGVSAP